MFLPRKGLLLPATLLLTLANSVQAQSITETENFGPSTPDFNTVLTFDSYTGPLSHLVSVEVTWSMSTTDGFLVIDNDGINPANGTYDFGAEIVLDTANTDVTLINGSFQPIFSNTEVANSGSFSLAGNTGDGGGDFDPTGPDGIGITGVPQSGSGGGFINNLFLAQFVSGTGGSAGSTYDIAIDTNEFLNVVSNGATEVLLTPVKAGGSVTVTYNIIPEPSTTLLGSLALLFVLRRRRA